MVRALVNWTQTERLRRLAVVLRPFFDRGLGAHEIAAELNGLAAGWRSGWRPRRPGDFIESRLARENAYDTDHARQEAERARELAEAADHQQHSEWQQWLASRDRARIAAMDAAPARTDADRARARLYAWDRWEEIAQHCEDDPADAEDLYGRKLCGYAIEKAAREAYDRV